MALLTDIIDPTASITENEPLEANAQLVPDKNGEYVRIVWLGEERSRINAYIKLLLTEAKKFYLPLYARRAKNKAAYESLKQKGGKDAPAPAITLSLVRSTVNQQHAWMMNRFFSKSPELLSGRALGDHEFEVIIPARRGPGGQVLPDGDAKLATVTATDEADGIADFLNFRWVYQLHLRNQIDPWLKDAMIDGSHPSILKFVASDGSPRYVTDNGMKTKDDVDGSITGTVGPYTIAYDPEQRTVEGEKLQIKYIPGERFGKTPGPGTIDEASLCWVEDELSKSEIRKRIASGRYDFGLPPKKSRTPDQQALFERLRSAALSKIRKDSEQSDSKKASRPSREAHGETEETFQPGEKDAYFETYLRWPILTKDELQKAKAEKRPPNIILTELVLDFQLDLGEQFCCWQLPWWSGRRPFVDLFLQPRPGSYSGNSTGEDVAPYQSYMSQLFQLQIQNLVIQNQSGIFIQNDAPCWSEIEKTRRIKPGFAYRINKSDDVQVEPLGKAVGNLNEQITFLKGLAQELGVYTQWDSAEGSLTRVTSGAFQQQQTQAKMQPEYQYENLCEAISRLALMDLQGLIQYARSVRVPEFAQKTKTVVENMLHLPRKQVTNADIAFEVVATSDDETKQAALAQAVQVLDTVTKQNEQILQGLANIAKPGQPPQLVAMAMRIIERSEECLAQVLKHIRSDYEQYIITPEDIQKMIASLHQMADQIGAGGQPGAPGAADVPGMAAAMNAPPPEAPPPPPAPPAPPQPTTKTTINYQIKGALTPSQESAIAASGGFAGTPGEPAQPAPVTPYAPGELAVAQAAAAPPPPAPTPPAKPSGT